MRITTEFSIYKRIAKILSCFVIVISVVLFALPSYAFLINGTHHTIDSYSISLNGKEFIPLLFVCEAFGVSYSWESLTNSIRLYKQGSLVRLVLNEQLMDVNGAIIRMQAPPQMVKGIVMIPASILHLPWWKADQISALYAGSSEFVIDKVILDPGHGGKDFGAVGKSTLREKDLVLDVSMQIKKELERRGITTLLTRDRDYFVTLAERAEMANATDADLYISIHANAHWDRRAEGFEVYYLSDTVDDSARAVEMIENAVMKYEDRCPFSEASYVDPTLWDIMLTENRRVSRELATSVDQVVKKEKMSTSRGVKHARFYVLKWVNKPSILIELGFITNHKEQRKLQRASYKRRFVDAIVRGILDYKRQYERSKGFTV